MNLREIVSGKIGSLEWLKAVATVALTVGVLFVAGDLASTAYGRLRAAIGVPAYEVVSVEHGGAVVVIREHGTGILRLCSMDGKCSGAVNVASARLPSRTVTLEQAMQH